MKENMLKLKPCKFCGGKAKFARTIEDLTVFSSAITDTPYRISVYCSDCNQTLSYIKDIDGKEKVKTRLFTSFEEATFAWNLYNSEDDSEDILGTSKPCCCIQNELQKEYQNMANNLNHSQYLIPNEYPIDNENKT